ncbi:MAG: hypothetical protein KDD69_02450 [Bdellovibrionales bacterium]|nr:hypothetical protein [Bdellovibrionales bacterium]
MSTGTNDYSISSFYCFVPFAPAEIARVQMMLEDCAERLDITGLIILAEEGLNGTVAGAAEGVAGFKELLQDVAQGRDLTFKDNTSSEEPFRRFKVKVRPEIVTIGRDDIHVVPDDQHYLSPSEWHAALESGTVGALGPFALIDTRNVYETKVGVFRDAVDPGLRNFQEFPQYVAQCGIKRNTPVLMYCTGGIRCEKAALEMQRQGYQHVYQLHGGILKYLEEYPDGYFEGECFVFDHRVAVDGNLKASERYRLCPHCGDPGENAICCGNCSKSAVLCERCSVERAIDTCSKDCREQQRRKLAKSAAA